VTRTTTHAPLGPSGVAAEGGRGLAAFLVYLGTTRSPFAASTDVPPGGHSERARPARPRPAREPPDGGGDPLPDPLDRRQDPDAVVATVPSDPFVLGSCPTSPRFLCGTPYRKNCPPDATGVRAPNAGSRRVRAGSMDATRLGKEGVPMMMTRVPRAQDGDSPPLDGRLPECGGVA
jgi:hypothetical protein